jgi:hypothetical protein
MFATAYMGRKRFFSNAFTLCVTGTQAFHNSRFPRLARALEGAAPRLFRPMYAGANMGHPSWVATRLAVALALDETNSCKPRRHGRYFGVDEASATKKFPNSRFLDWAVCSFGIDDP